MSRARHSVNLIDPAGFIGPFNNASMTRLQDVIQRHEGTGFLWNEQLLGVMLKKARMPFTEWRDPHTEDLHGWYRGYEFKLFRGRAIILWPRFNDLKKIDGTSANREMTLYATKEHDVKQRDEMVEHFIKVATTETVLLRPLPFYASSTLAQEVRDLELEYISLPRKKVESLSPREYT